MGNSVRGYIYVLSENKKNIDNVFIDIKQNKNKEKTISFPFGGDYIEISNLESVIVGKYHGLKFWSWSKNSLPTNLMDKIASTYGVVCYTYMSIECDLDDECYITSGEKYQMLSLEPNFIHRFNYSEEFQDIYSKIYNETNIFTQKNIASIIDKFIVDDFIKLSDCPLIRTNMVCVECNLENLNKIIINENFNIKEDPQLIDYFIYFFDNPEQPITPEDYDKCVNEILEKNPKLILTKNDVKQEKHMKEQELQKQRKDSFPTLIFLTDNNLMTYEIKKCWEHYEMMVNTCIFCENAIKQIEEGTLECDEDYKHVYFEDLEGTYHAAHEFNKQFHELAKVAEINENKGNTGGSILIDDLPF